MSSLQIGKVVAGSGGKVHGELSFNGDRVSDGGNPGAELWCFDDFADI